MKEGDRQTIVLIIIIFFVFIITICAIGYTIIQLIQSSSGLFSENKYKTKVPFILNTPQESTTFPIIIDRNYNYNFLIKYEGIYFTPDKELDYNFKVGSIDLSDSYPSIEAQVVDEGLLSEPLLKEIEYIPIQYGNLVRIKIPRIGVDSPVLQGFNVYDLLKQGWWLYPASYTNGPGEKIFYCHRRYFGRFDPRTCWNLNQVILDDLIYLYNSDGQIFTYKVISTSIVRGDVLNTMRPSTKEYVKIITCGTENGAPGGNDYRVVVLAELQS